MSEWKRHALLAVDIQNDFLTDIPDPGTFRRSVESVLGYCRDHGVRVYHLRVKREQDRSNWLPFERLRGRAPCVQGTRGAETPEWAEATSDEPVIEKAGFDVFLGTDLEERLRADGIEHVFVAGLVTSVCILVTAIAAVQRGFLVTVLTDCVSDEEPDHSDTLRRYGDSIFDTRSSHEMGRSLPSIEATLDRIRSEHA
jgi:nicotinamidase-related amidase